MLMALRCGFRSWQASCQELGVKFSAVKSAASVVRMENATQQHMSGRMIDFIHIFRCERLSSSLQSFDCLASGVLKATMLSTSFCVNFTCHMSGAMKLIFNADAARPRHSGTASIDP